MQAFVGVIVQVDTVVLMKIKWHDLEMQNMKI